MSLLYLDWASTTPISPDALREVTRAAEEYPANPSSLHADGKAARAVLEDARERLAILLGCASSNVVFTSGGTESDSIVLLALLRRPQPGVIVISSIEHPAVFEQASILERLGWKVRRVDPMADGRVSPASVADACSGGAALVSIMAVNNETGAIQPLADIHKAITAASGSGRRPRIHSDAVQAFGKITFRPKDLGLDFAALSAHKIRGPRGVGALFTTGPLDPLSMGGGQESGIRSGTENLPGILGFVRAAQICEHERTESFHTAGILTDRLLSHARTIPDVRPIPECRVEGDERYSPWILSLALPGLSGETAVRVLSDRGFAVSTGSACSSSKRKRRVLESMGVPESLAFSTIRISIGPSTDASAIDSFAQALRDIYLRYRT